MGGGGGGVFFWGGGGGVGVVGADFEPTLTWIDASIPSKASALNERTPGGSVHHALSCGAVGKDHRH